MVQHTLELGIAELVRILGMLVAGQRSDPLLARLAVNRAEHEFGAAMFPLHDPGLTGPVGELAGHGANLQWLWLAVAWGVGCGVSSKLAL